MPHAAVEGLMSLGDIAELARVRRPVVSTWRRRPMAAGKNRPFPSPVPADGGRDLFRVKEVVEWLEWTGRGNNPQARADALAHVLLPTSSVGSVREPEALTSLLCLKAMTGETLGAVDAEQIVDLADEVDPDDDFLFREIERLGSRTESMTTYIDELTDAAYDVSGALERLLALTSVAGSATHLGQAALELVGSLTSALSLDLGAGRVTIVDATGGSSALLGAALEAMGEQIDCTVHVSGDDDAARAMRRIGHIRGWSFAWSLASDDPAVVIGQFPNSSNAGMTTAEVLTAIDDVQLELGDGQRAVILAPASVLCDRLADTALDVQRDHLVRLGRLRFVGRLPQGLVTGRSRQSLGLWTLGSNEPARIDDRWVAVADLTDLTLSPDVVDDLVTDVVAAMGPRPLTRAHAFRFARISHTASLLAGRGPLVPAGIRPATVNARLASEQAVRARELVAGLSTAPLERAVQTLRVAATPSTAPGVGSVVLSQAVDQGHARVLPGARMSVDTVAPGTVRVFTADDFTGSSNASAAGVDPLDLESRYPRVRRTEVGDVVFCTSPRPRAVVDEEGLSVVAYPARILRCGTGSGLVPEAVAWAINNLPPSARHWRSWRMPLVPDAQETHLAETLRDIAAEREVVRQRIERLDELADVLVTGVSAGALTIELPTQTAAANQTAETTTEEGR